MTIYIPEENRALSAAPGETLLSALRRGGLAPDAPCGGNGKCGKCRVLAEGREVLACQTVPTGDMTVTLPKRAALRVLGEGAEAAVPLKPLQPGDMLAFDLGTTSLVCYLLQGRTGEELGRSSMENPQTAFGADVISRIQRALSGEMEALTQSIRQAMEKLIATVTDHPEEVGVVSVVGNPAMQQLFLGISPENLAAVPFREVLNRAEAVPCGTYLPLCPNARLLIVPDISGYVGADTLGCVLATELYKKEEITLMVDIGTNGEMVLGNRHRMVACATAAGPALEGANIRFGMRAAAGAIDHVRVEDGALRCTVLGGGPARGICGSGLIDAVAGALELGLINRRGKLLTEDGLLHLTGDICLTQEDIRQLQLAKGAIAAGIGLMAGHLGIAPEDIAAVRLAGAFGSYLDPASACRIGLLPAALSGKIQPVGNAAGSGAKMLAKNRDLLDFSQTLVEKIEFLELASLPDFPKAFAKGMWFDA